MSRKFIRVIIPVLIVVEFSFVFLTFMSYQNRDVTSIKETTKIDKKRFAMYVENMDGEYEEVGDVPFEGRHLLNLEKTTCVDNKGNKLENVITYNNNQITVTSNKTLFCYLYFDMKIDIQVDVETDGEAGVVPTTLGYNKSITCEDGTTPTWNYKYNRLEFTGINSDETKCKLTYTKDTKTYENLRNVVENAEGIERTTYQEPNYDSVTPFSLDEYKTLKLLYTGTGSDAIETETTTAFEFKDGAWNTIVDNLISNYYYIIEFSVQNDGYYQLCYSLSEGHTSNQIELGRNGGRITRLVGSGSDCYEIYFDNEDIIRVTIKTQSDATSGISNATFNVNKPETTIYETGYRYVGTNPDNYIWFNNEMWRIIGSIPTKVSEDGTTENLVKIIKKESIGSIVFDAKTSGYTGEWGENTLYNLLNEYYYGKKNGTESGYCLGHITNSLYTSKTNCDYTTTGIAPNGVYGNMIENVYWNAGGAGNNTTNARDVFYEGELLKQTAKGHIGLMAASDYGYATLNKYHTTTLNNYNTYDITNNNWIFSQGNEWMINSNAYNSSSLGSGAMIVYHNGSVTGDDAKEGHVVRPVIYLDSSVYIIAGAGTEANPYLIAMN